MYKKLLVFTGILTLLFSCQKTDNKSSTSSNKTQGSDDSKGGSKEQISFLSEDNPLGKFKELAEVTSWTKTRPDLIYPNGDTWDSNQWTRGLKDDLNLKIKYVWSAPGGDDFNSKLNTSLASGDLPDLLPFISKDLFPELVSKNILQDLEPAYEKFASPELKSNVEAYDGRYKKYNLTAGQEGKMFGLNVPDALIFKFHIGYLRKNWLDALGLQMPKTLDDLYKIMKAFANDDPDGNGAKDTVGFAMGNTLFSGISNPLILFAAYDSYPKSWVKQDDKLVYSALQDNTKNVLVKLHELYQDGVIHKEFPAISTRDVGALITKPKAGIFMEQTWGPPGVYSLTWSKDDPVEWVPFKIPSASGNGFARNITNLKSPVLYAMKNGTKYPEAVVKIMNYIFEEYYNNPKFSTYKRDNGEEAENNLFGQIIPVDSFDMDYKYMPTLWEALEKEDPSNLKSRYKYFYNKILSYKKGQRDAITNGQWYFVGPEGSIRKGIELEQEGGYKFNEYLGYPDKKMNQSITNMESKMEEMFINIIVGSVTVDEGWKQWTDYWNNMGGADIEKKVNEWYSKNK